MSESSVQKIRSTESTEETLAKQLSTVLSELYATRLKAQVYHWNFEGSRFYGVHKTLEEVYESFDDFIDDLAERIRTIGGRPISSYAEIARLASVQNSSSDKASSSPDMIEDIVESLNLFNRRLKESMKTAKSQDDPVSEDLLLQILSKSEKFRWMMQSFQAGSTS